MRLIPDDFPLRVIGVNIYCQTRSSPILIADDPAVANLTCAMMNNMDAPTRKLAQEGPFVLGPPQNGILMAANL